MKHVLIRRIAWSALAAMIIARPALAAYEDVGVGARVSGLGHAYTAVADDVYSVYYNPAGLATLDRPEFGTTYSRLLTGLSDGSNVSNSFLGYAHPIDGGRRGTAGAAWNNFGVGGLYSENQLMFSYGHSLFARTEPDRYYLGGTIKYLSRSIGGTSAAANGISNTGVATGTPDPGLQNTSKMNIDADLGFLWRIRPRWTAGLMIQHLMEPNIGFSESDKLGRNIKLGGAYKTPFSTLTGDVRLQSAPDGSTDKILAVAAEKWLPTLLHGMFGVRGSLSMGSRDFRQVALGLSYKINRMQFDYGFALPIGGLNSTSGSHRLGLTMRFGRPKQAEAAFGEAILENLRDLAAVGTPEFRYQMEDLALYKRTAIDEFLRQAKLDATGGRFSDAADKLSQAVSLKPKDPRLQQSLARMTAVADVYPAVKEYQTDASQAAVYEGALDFVAGNGKESLRKLAYAGTLNPTDERIERLAKAVEDMSGLTRIGPAPDDSGKAPTMGAEKVVGGTMALMEVALRERDFERVVKLADQVLQIDPSNALAYKRLGAAHYALKHNPEALKALRSAYKLETDSDSRKQIKSYIDALQSLIERGRRESAPAKTVEPIKSSGLSPVEVERIYEQGVDLYAQGKLTEAAAAFRRILDSEPNNTSARRALDRVQSEIITGGDKK